MVRQKFSPLKTGKKSNNTIEKKNHIQINSAYQFFVSEASYTVVVYQTGALHKGITNDAAGKFKTPLF